MFLTTTQQMGSTAQEAFRKKSMAQRDDFKPWATFIFTSAQAETVSLPG